MGTTADSWTVAGALTVSGAAVIGGSVTAAHFHGPANAGTTYPGFDVDGTNPPTVSYMRMYDQATGAYRVIYLNNGTLTII